MTLARRATWTFWPRLPPEQNRASGVPELHYPPEVTLLVRDGRIFSLVRRLDDYDGTNAPGDVLYGDDWL